ncbi:MAG: hypothetical protein U5K53_08625 [Halanaerobiales bacterium]|nr:hypothetical protein [Halanaerobiales bacterium]
MLFLKHIILKKIRALFSGSSYIENDIKAGGFIITSKNESLENRISFDLHREKANDFDLFEIELKNKLNEKLYLDMGMNFKIEKNQKAK